jgi:hypothetical protein
LATEDVIETRDFTWLHDARSSTTRDAAGGHGGETCAIVLAAN